MRKSRLYETIIPKKVCYFLLASYFLVSLGFAQSGDPYVLDWSTIDSGGGVTRGGQYWLRCTIGQPEVGTTVHGDYEVRGGFWLGGPLCFVDFEDYARFAQYWLGTGSDMPADLHKDQFDTVNFKDFDEFVYWWLYDCPYDWPLK